MITILWTEFCGDRWERCTEEEAEILMNDLKNDYNVNTDDIIIFYDGSNVCSGTGNTFNIENGTQVKIISENKWATIKSRNITEIGIEYTVVYNKTGIEEIVFDSNIEL